MNPLAEQDRRRTEHNLYRLARRKGYRLEKCRLRDKNHEAYATYQLTINNQIVEAGANAYYGATLEQIAKYLDRH
jgi:hypothetical protein